MSYKAPSDEYLNAYISSRGMGGGLGVFISGNCTNNTINVHHSEFIENQAISGGGLHIQFHNFTYNNTIVIRESEFLNNSANLSGGGVSIYYLNHQKLTTRTNQVIFRDVNLFDNSAKFGGGLAVIAEFGDTRYKPGAKIVFRHCSWKNNTAVYSPAIDIAPFLDRYSDRTGFLPIPIFIEIELHNNSLI